MMEIDHTQFGALIDALTAIASVNLVLAIFIGMGLVYHFCSQKE
jgi:hypothetical protein